MAAQQQTLITVRVGGQSFYEVEEVITAGSKYIRAQIEQQKSTPLSRLPILKLFSAAEPAPLVVDINQTAVSTWKVYMDFVKGLEIDINDYLPLAGSDQTGAEYFWVDMIFLGVRIDNRDFAAFAREGLLSYAESKPDLVPQLVTEYFVQQMATANGATSYSEMLTALLMNLAKRHSRDYVERVTSTLERAKTAAEEQLHEAKQAKEALYPLIEQLMQTNEMLSNTKNFLDRRNEINDVLKAYKSQDETLRKLKDKLEAETQEHTNDLERLREQMDTKDQDAITAEREASEHRQAFEELRAEVIALASKADSKFLLTDTTRTATIATASVSYPLLLDNQPREEDESVERGPAEDEPASYAPTSSKKRVSESDGEGQAEKRVRFNV